MAFPWNLVKVMRDSYAVTPNQPSRRTSFDSGLISEKRVNSRPWMTRSFDFAVYETDVSAFIEWQRMTGSSFFDFRDDHDGVTRKARVVGGADSIEIVKARDLLDGNRYRTGGMTLEGYG